jgi:hypothetical protein
VVGVDFRRENCTKTTAKKQELDERALSGSECCGQKAQQTKNQTHTTLEVGELNPVGVSPQNGSKCDRTKRKCTIGNAPRKKSSGDCIKSSAIPYFPCTSSTTSELLTSF